MKSALTFIFLTLILTVRTESLPDPILWNEAPQFTVEIEGKTDWFARVFQPHDYRPYLVLLLKGLKKPVLMNLTTREVSLFDDKAIRQNDEISFHTDYLPKGNRITTYSMKSGLSVFQINGKMITIRVKETLVGEVSQAILLAHSPLYAVLRDQYKPQKKAIESIKNCSRPIEIVVMFATWCPTCKQMVPKLLRILKESNNVHITVKFIGIAMGGQEPRDLLKKYGEDYPAFIVFENGKEKARIIGMTPNPLEESLAAIIKK